MIPAPGWNYNADRHARSACAGGNFVANDIYEFSYTAKDPTVNGLGFAAVRDWNAWLRYDDARRLRQRRTRWPATSQRIYTEISSQPGRFLNDFRHLGFNQAENGKKVFDGLMQWIAAGNGINLNYRFSQPGRTERNRQDHLYVEGVFPFANVTTHRPDHRQDRQPLRSAASATNTCPLAVEIYSANEYWVKAASLLHTDARRHADLPDSPYARNYFISSHQHGTGNARQQGQLPAVPESARIRRRCSARCSSRSTNGCNGTQPPPSRVPRLRDGTLVAAAAAVGSRVSRTSRASPTPGLKTTRYLFDYGPELLHDGHRDHQPAAGARRRTRTTRRNGPIYPSFVPKTDSDGNDIAGVRLPDVTRAAGHLHRLGAARAARRPTTAARRRASTSRSRGPRPSAWPAAIRVRRSRSAIRRSASTTAQGEQRDRRAGQGSPDAVRGRRRCAGAAARRRVSRPACRARTATCRRKSNVPHCHKEK